MLDLIKQPWPWYVAGPIIGLTVPLLLLMGNKTLGVSAALRHVCAACLPAGIPFFKYEWKREIWNIFFVLGIFIGGLITVNFLMNDGPATVNPELAANLQQYGITDYSSLLPVDVMNWHTLFTLKGFVLMIAGGFLVGFGTRYAGGCTSGHAIMGLSNLQWPSLIAVCSFMIGGFIMTNLFLHYILSL
jgi:uncharacterized protein